ncbi:MAG: hypothetical protein ACAH59_10625 [Pseudobdellovibrionaceae bacterium]
MMRFFAGFLMALALGCATEGYRIKNQNLSLGDIKRAVEAAIGEPRTISENQRTFYSQYFSRKPDPKFDPVKSKERAYAKVVILGDRRPYEVDVEVLIEVRDSRGYVQSGTDLSEAKKVGKEIRAKLNLSREDRNVIDDFRAF